MRGTWLVRSHKKLSFVRINGFKIQVHRGGTASVAGVGNAFAKVIHLAWFGGETGESGQFREPLPARLPTRAKVMLSGLDSEGEIGVCPRGANPGAVHSDSKRGISYFTWGFPEVFGDIDQRLAGLELTSRLAGRCLSLTLGTRRAPGAWG